MHRVAETAPSCWIQLLPLYHMTRKVDHRSQGMNFDEEKWWGIAELREHIAILKAKSQRYARLKMEAM